MRDEEADPGTRIGAMFIDHVAMVFVVGVFAIPVIISSFVSAFDLSHDTPTPDLFGDTPYILLLGFALYFCKDSFNGRSIAKRILKLQVVDNTTDEVASPVKCLVRNIFCIIWPVEVIATLVNPSRRIGDIVAGTRVVRFYPDHEQPKPKLEQIGLSLLLAYGLMLLIFQPFEALNRNLSGSGLTYVESSINEEAASELEQLFADSLGNHLTADVRVYDQVKGVDDLKYVSIVLKLKEDYLEYDSDFREIKSVVEPLIYSQYPRGTLYGRLKYHYSRRGTSRFRTETLR